MNDGGATLRLFLAIPLPEPVGTFLLHQQAWWRSQLPQRTCRWTPVGQMHLTLRFLGSVSPRDLAVLESSVRSAVSGFAPFTLEVAGSGGFPDRSRPRVLWAGVAGDRASLLALQRAVAKASAAWGDRDETEFHPHLTLARVRMGEQLEELPMQPEAQEIAASWLVEYVDLFHSELQPSGAVHRLRSRFLLATDRPRPAQFEV